MKLLIPVVALALMLACSRAPIKPQGNVTTPPTAPAGVASFMLSSPEFADNEAIPDKYSGKDTNYSPPLNWYDVPERTKSFALIVEDPDAPSGTFTHWLA